jgi:hypothetical protein
MSSYNVRPMVGLSKLWWGSCSCERRLEVISGFKQVRKLDVSFVCCIFRHSLLLNLEIKITTGLM